MPRPGPRRENVVVRMSNTLTSAMDARAADEDVNRSDFVRHAVQYALEAMPPGWRPLIDDGAPRDT